MTFEQYWKNNAHKEWLMVSRQDAKTIYLAGVEVEGEMMHRVNPIFKQAISITPPIDNLKDGQRVRCIIIKEEQ